MAAGVWDPSYPLPAPDRQAT